MGIRGEMVKIAVVLIAALCCGAMGAIDTEDVVALQESSGACGEGQYDAGSVEVAGEDDSAANCKPCTDLAPTLFGGKGRPKGNGNCERECGECERPTPHPTHGPICWGTMRDGVADLAWMRNDNPDDAPVGSCVCKQTDDVCRGTAVIDGVATWFCRQIGQRSTRERTEIVKLQEGNQWQWILKKQRSTLTSFQTTEYFMILHSINGEKINMIVNRNSIGSRSID